MIERTTTGSLLRTAQAFCLQLCDKQTLDLGIAYYCERFSALPEANQFREVIAADPSEVSGAYRQAQEWFSRNNLTCHRWAPADGRANAALDRFLSAKGFAKRTYAAMLLTSWPHPESGGKVNVLPARAMREAFRQTFLADDVPEERQRRELLADAFEERMNDPHLDMFVAIVESKPVGRGGLFQVGDIARVMVPRVAPAPHKPLVEDSLLAHTLALAKRLTMRRVVTRVGTDDRDRMVRLEEAGFVADGEIVEYDRESATAP